LTHSLHRKNPFGGKVRAYTFNFEAPERLARSLEGVSVLYNTYWVRFNHPYFNIANAERNTRILFDAAGQAGVKRLVHVSITNPSEDAPLEYFRGKARVEKALMQSGLSYAILRPAVLFGKEDILINNIAWVLRHFPVFWVFGDGQYKLQPIHVDDLARLAVEQSRQTYDTIVNAIGPQTFTYRELVRTLAEALGKRRLLISVPPGLGYAGGRLLGALMGDVMITRDEIQGLMTNRLYVDAPPAGSTKLTDWAYERADLLGRQYRSELARRKDRLSEYP
ncbi:MAG: SDR family oxidoreductase, partial [Desulfosalsimonas sp.]